MWFENFFERVMWRGIQSVQMKGAVNNLSQNLYIPQKIKTAAMQHPEECAVDKMGMNRADRKQLNWSRANAVKFA